MLGTGSSLIRGTKTISNNAHTTIFTQSVNSGLISIFNTFGIAATGITIFQPGCLLGRFILQQTLMVIRFLIGISEGLVVPVQLGIEFGQCRICTNG